VTLFHKLVHAQVTRDHSVNYLLIYCKIMQLGLFSGMNMSATGFKCSATVRKVEFKKVLPWFILQRSNNSKGHSTLSEMAQFNWPYITCY